MEEQNSLRYLIRLAGKIIFVIGLILNIIMVMFGFWPSLIYILLMLVGAGMFSFSKNNDSDSNSFKGIGGRIENALNRLPAIKSKTFFGVLRIAVFTFIGVIFAAVLFFTLSQDYFKKRDTQNDCKEITASLNDFYKQKKEYPSNLSQIISGYPLRQNWNKDYWGHNYSYKTGGNNTSFTLVSAGEDGKLNTKDDLIFSNQ